jgi:hypothetical protein
LKVHGDYLIISETGNLVADTHNGLFEGAKGDAVRLVAAWNACEGIPTEVIEGLNLREYREASVGEAEQERQQQAAKLIDVREKCLSALGALNSNAPKVAHHHVSVAIIMLNDSLDKLQQAGVREGEGK